MTRLLTILILGLGLGPAAALSADTTFELEILDFYIYPDDEDEANQLNKLGGYTWPEVTELNALVKVRVGGFHGEQKVDLYMVVLDEEEEVVSKHKGKHYLPAGEHSLVFPEFISTADVFGLRSYELQVEADMKGIKPVTDSYGFDLEGPDPPHIDIIDTAIFNVGSELDRNYFEPGNEFIFEGLFEVEDNDSEIPPEVIVFAMLDEDMFLIDPEMNYQPYDTHWDSRTMEHTEGMFQVRARGVLPRYFAEYHGLRHDWRVYLIVDFGTGVTKMDYAAAELYDHDSGENRYSDELVHRLIELDRAYQWDVKRLRGGRPETDNFWER